MVQDKKTHTTGRKIVAAIASIITIALLFNVSAQAQPLSKRVVGFTVKENTKRVVIPFNYSNYKKVGPPSRGIYVLIQKSEYLKKTNIEAKGKLKEPANAFLKEKRHMASLETYSQSTLPENRNSTNFFLNQKRHF